MFIDWNISFLNSWFPSRFATPVCSLPSSDRHKVQFHVHILAGAEQNHPGRRCAFKALNSCGLKWKLSRFSLLTSLPTFPPSPAFSPLFCFYGADFLSFTFSESFEADCTCCVRLCCCKRCFSSMCSLTSALCHPPGVKVGSRRGSGEGVWEECGCESLKPNTSHLLMEWNLERKVFLCWS